MKPYVALVLAALTSACSASGRTFVRPTDVLEVRPMRALRTQTAASDDETFRVEVPRILKSKAQKLSTPTESRLSNGVRVVFLERHDFPTVSTVLVLDRGHTAAEPGVARTYALAMTGSSASYESSDAWTYLRYVGAHAEATALYDGILFETRALSPLAVSALSRTIPMFTNPNFETKDIERARIKMDSIRATSKTDPDTIALLRLRKLMFPSPHPYGEPLVGPVSDANIDTWEKRTALFRDQFVNADHVTVVCVGDFRPTTMLRVFEKALGGLPHAKTTAPVAAQVARAQTSEVLLIDRPGALQSHVAIGWDAPRAGAPDNIPLDVLSHAAAGGLSSRLNLRVRAELGATYGVHMNVHAWRDAGLVEMRSAVDTRRTGEAVRDMLAEINRLGREPLAEQELHAAKLRAQVHSLESAHALARRLAYAAVEGRPLDEVTGNDERVTAVTAEAVRRTAERYLTPEKARIVIVGDASKVESGLRALGLGEVRVER